jgi:hypothetical protein
MLAVGYDEVEAVEYRVGVRAVPEVIRRRRISALTGIPPLSPAGRSLVWSTVDVAATSLVVAVTSQGPFAVRPSTSPRTAGWSTWAR